MGLENRLFLPRDYGLLLPILRGLVSHLNLKIDLQNSDVTVNVPPWAFAISDAM